MSFLNTLFIYLGKYLLAIRSEGECETVAAVLERLNRTGSAKNVPYPDGCIPRRRCQHTRLRGREGKRCHRTFVPCEHVEQLARLEGP